MGWTVTDFTEQLHPRDTTGKWAAKGGGDPTAAHRTEQLSRLHATRNKRIDDTPPEVKSATLSLLHDAGGLSAAADAIKDYHDKLIDPESGKAVDPQHVRDALEALRPPPLPHDEEYVTVHHATDAETAEKILKDGLIPELKPHTLASERYASGEDATFSPGAGLSRGTYVAEPGKAESYGRVVLEMKIPKSYLEVSPEQATLGVTDAGESLKTHDGAIISKAIPPEAIRDAREPEPAVALPSAPDVSVDVTLPPELHQTVTTTARDLVDVYPELQGLKITGGAPAGTMAIKSTRRIMLNTDEWNNPAGLAEYERKWKGLVIDSSPAGTIVHEAGHVVDAAVRERLGDDYYRIVQSHFPEVYTQPEGGITASVSVFGQENPAEFMAETFSSQHFHKHEMGRIPEANDWMLHARSMWDELFTAARRAP
jgi:hypothetical protein